MKDLIKKKIEGLQEWMREYARKEYHSEIENYLQQSVDAADLEQRIRNLRERGYAI